MSTNDGYERPEYQAAGYLRPSEVWTLTLTRYQRDNLLWLIHACGYGAEGVEPFTFANNGDWIGEIHWMLGAASSSGVGPGVSVTHEPRHPNATLDQLRDRVAQWLEAQRSERGQG